MSRGGGTHGSCAHTYVSSARRSEIERLPDLAAERGHDAFCLADDEGPDGRDQGGAGGGLSATQQHNVVAAFLEAYFPVPSPFEQHPAPSGTEHSRG